VTYLVTGGAGFIGSAVVRALIGAGRRVVTLDRLTYAGNLESLAEARDHPRHAFVHGDVCDRALLRRLFAEHRPDVVLHLAAESHVDRSIDAPQDFVRTNVTGTGALLDEARRRWRGLAGEARERSRGVHVSTDEVFGSLGDAGRFDERTPYAPASPYAASKAAADHLARAWHRTYGLPVVVTSCSNNYGPYQFPEKLIPLTIIRALRGQSLPVYGKGENVRDWLHVEDHAEALTLVLCNGKPGETYNVGGDSERKNIDVVRTICRLLDEMVPGSPHRPHERLIEFVTDRPGHDARYAIDAAKIKRELGWRPRHGFEDGLRQTVRWYLDHKGWWERVMSGAYRGERLGLG